LIARKLQRSVTSEVHDWAVTSEVAHLRTCAACAFPHKLAVAEVAKPRFSPISPQTLRGKILPLARNRPSQNYLCHQGSPPA
jgi:hypothetical protein